MDFDIIDDTRPRLQLKTGPASSSYPVPEPHLNKVQVSVCCSIGIGLLAFSWTLIGPLQFLAFWVGLSFVVGPLAPISFTGGDCRVGVGDPIPRVQEEPLRGPHPSRIEVRNGSRKEPEVVRGLKDDRETVRVVDDGAGARVSESRVGNRDVQGKEFSDQEFELLRKLIVKYPRGTSRRWEVIAEALGGRHSADSVVKAVKELSERRNSDRDSYTKFLAQRKSSDIGIESPLSRRSELGNGVPNDDDGAGFDASVSDSSKKDHWSDTEDKALVSALKTFPKDSSMRWDKVAAAVPGKTKAQCFRRFSELRKNFRDARADVEAD